MANKATWALKPINPRQATVAHKKIQPKQLGHTDYPITTKKMGLSLSKSHKSIKIQVNLPDQAKPP